MNCQIHSFLILVFCFLLTRERNFETLYLTIWQKPANKQKAQVVYKEETAEFCCSKNSAGKKFRKAFGKDRVHFFKINHIKELLFISSYFKGIWIGGCVSIPTDELNIVR